MKQYTKTNNRSNKEFNSITALAHTINNRLHKDFDFPICISGLTGMGKSNIAIQLGKELARLNNIDFDFNKNICFSRKEIYNAVMGEKPVPRFSLVSLDEAINTTFKREFMNRDQNILIKMFQMCRWRNLCIAFAIPNFWSLDREILQSYLKMWIWIRERGTAEIFVPYLDNPWIADKWFRDANVMAFNSGRMALSENHAGTIYFDDYLEKDKELYLKIKHEKSKRESKFGNVNTIDLGGEKNG